MTDDLNPLFVPKDFKEFDRTGVVITDQVTRRENLIALFKEVYFSKSCVNEFFEDMAEFACGQEKEIARLNDKIRDLKGKD